MNQALPVDVASLALNAPVSIRSTATAVPKHRFTQDEAMQRACRLVPGYAHLSGIFQGSGIETRYSSVPLDWYDRRTGWRESNAIYVENALDLLTRVAGDALANAGLHPQDVGAIVLVSSTGFSIPGVEATLCNRMGFAARAQRTPLFGLGCAGGTTGLARASQLARSLPDRPVLLLVVELGGLNVHYDPDSAAMFVATALFGDGAAAAVLCCGGPGGGLDRARVVASGEHLWPNSEGIMRCVVEDDGFDLILSGTLPRFTRDGLLPVVKAFLAEQHMTIADLAGYVVHPGSLKVLETIDASLGLSPDALVRSRDVLREFGNMSAPSVLFALEKTLAAGSRGPHLMMSFGPGFTASFALLDLG